MTEAVSLPIWTVVVVSGFALWAVLDRVLVPGLRWILRRRVNRVISDLNTRLKLQVPPFQQTKRRVLIDRLMYDPQVMESVEAESRASGVPRDVLARQVARYAREIVPSFNVYVYFPHRVLPGAARSAVSLPRPPGLCGRRSAGRNRTERQRSCS